MCLLFLIHELKDRLTVFPEVIHINHGIRGINADKDEEYEKYTKTKKFVEEMAEGKLGLVHDGEVIFKPDGEK